MNCGSLRSNSTRSSCWSSFPAASPLGWETTFPVSSGSKESTWGSSVMALSFFLPGSLGLNIRRSLPYLTGPFPLGIESPALAKVACKQVSGERFEDLFVGPERSLAHRDFAVAFHELRRGPQEFGRTPTAALHEP